MKIGIIGSGITGLACAYFLSKKGYDITIYEKNKELGGLLSTIKINHEPIEKFYHHFFKSDIDLIDLLKELNIYNKVKWYNPKMGFFVDGKKYYFNTPLDLLKFRPLSLFDRFNFGLLILYFKHKKDWKDMEDISAQDYITKKFSKNIYDITWKPLLMNKFGQHHTEISASWLWGRINARSNSRGGGGEELGYIDGSFQVLVDSLVDELKKKNVKIVNKEIKEIKKLKNKVAIKSNKVEEYDKVIFAGPSKILTKLIKFPQEYLEKLDSIEYQDVLCTILETKKPLSDIYWLNISDNDLPFGGVIEHTNLIPNDRYSTNLVYLFNYLNQGNPMFNLPDNELMEKYIAGLKKMFPNFDEKIITKSTTFRGKFATPIYKINYSKIMPPYKTPVENLYICNTTQIYPEDRNTSNSIRIARECCKLLTKVDRQSN